MKLNHRSLFLCALLCGAVLGSSCRSSGTNTDEQENVSFRTLLYGYQSGLKGGIVRVVRNEAEWRELWIEHTAPMMPRPDAPEVNWEKDMLVVVTLDERPTAGYGIAIENIEHEGNRLIVNAIEKRPGQDAIEPQVITHPYVMAETARTEGEVAVELHLK